MQPGKKGGRCCVKGLTMDKPNKSRRSFLKILPLGVWQAYSHRLAALLFVFCGPDYTAASDRWLDVANLSELSWPTACQPEDCCRTHCRMGGHDRRAQRLCFTCKRQPGAFGDLSSRRMRSRMGTKCEPVFVPVPRELFCG